jgi:hypothetical protein
MTELRAVAAGAGVDTRAYFLLNNREADLESPEHFHTDHCTTAVSMSDTGSLMGHNEDWGSQSIHLLYVLKATINSLTFIGLNYCIFIPGSSASMNSEGLVQGINDLWHPLGFGVPRNFLARAVLQCRTLDQAETVITSTKRASGHNHVLVQGREVRNIETSARRVYAQSMLNKSFVHTNHCLVKSMQADESEPSVSSRSRLTRAQALVRNDMTVAEMATLLADNGNAEYPIFRPDATIGSVILKPESGEMYVAASKPIPGAFTRYTL